MPTGSRQPHASLFFALSAYLEMCREGNGALEALIPLIESGFSMPLPPRFIPSPQAMRLIAGAHSNAHISHLLGQFLSMGGQDIFRRMYFFVLDALTELDGSPSAQCECPFVFYFVKYCLDQGLGVPVPLLAAYEHMRGQLSCSFIRCGNPTCELNRLDRSIAKVQFKRCGRCKAVIYCSRDCQVAHYPDHKKLCKAPAVKL